MRPTRFLVAACLAPVVLALGACTGGSSGDAAGTVSSTTGAPATAGTEPGPSVSATPAAGGGAAGCAAKGLKAELTIQRAGMAMLVLTNVGSSPCRVEGWVDLRLEGADGGVLKVSQQRVDEPGESVPADLDPGESAFAGIKWTTCDKSSQDCAVASTVRVGPAGAGDLVVAHLTGAEGGNQTVTELPLSAVQIGTVQPSRQGVVAW